jgi:hypothetical protein
MLGKAIKYTFVTIGAYLVLAYSTGFGRDVNAVTGFVTHTTKTLQARA